MRGWIARALIAGLGLAVLAPVSAAQAGTCPTPLAHKGYVTSYHDENTIPAIRGAAKFGGAEIDVHVTKDKKLVVIHNAKVNSTTNGRGFVQDMTLKQIRKLRTDNGYRVPTLASAAKLAARKDMTLVVELKLRQHWTPKIYRSAATIAKRATRDGAKIYLGGRGSGFERDIPEYATGALIYWRPGRRLALNKANAVALEADLVMARVGQWNRSKVRNFKKAGMVTAARKTTNFRRVRFLGLQYALTNEPRSLTCR